MKLEDFDKIPKNDHDFLYLSKEKFLYDDGKVKFWYRYLIDHWTFQPGWDKRHDTDFNSYIVVDWDESVHESHKNPEKWGPKKVTDSFYLPFFGFHLKTRTVTYCKNPVEKDYEIVAERIDKHRIDTKIKKDKYERIKGIINGYDSVR